MNTKLTHRFKPFQYLSYMVFIYVDVTLEFFYQIKQIDFYFKEHE